MNRINLREEMIKLGQALKLAGLVSSGADAKSVIQNKQVKVNGIIEVQRGRKLFDQDQFEYKGQTVLVCAPKKELNAK
jgi:ribosome-associated protein